jgi:hypothetical protein
VSYGWNSLRDLSYAHPLIGPKKERTRKHRMVQDPHTDTSLKSTQSAKRSEAIVPSKKRFRGFDKTFRLATAI